MVAYWLVSGIGLEDHCYDVVCQTRVCICLVECELENNCLSQQHTALLLLPICCILRAGGLQYDWHITDKFYQLAVHIVFLLFFLSFLAPCQTRWGRVTLVLHGTNHIFYVDAGYLN
jgi:hypothetical protein